MSLSSFLSGVIDTSADSAETKVNRIVINIFFLAVIAFVVFKLVK